MRAFMSEKGRERGKDRKRAPRLCSKRERERERRRDVGLGSIRVQYVIEKNDIQNEKDTHH